MTAFEMKKCYCILFVKAFVAWFQKVFLEVFYRQVKFLSWWVGFIPLTRLSKRLSVGQHTIAFFETHAMNSFMSLRDIFV